MHIHVKKNTPMYWLINAILERQQAEEITTVELLTAFVAVIVSHMSEMISANNSHQFFNAYSGVVTSLDCYSDTFHTSTARGSDKPRAFVSFTSIGKKIADWCNLIDLDYILVDNALSQKTVDTMKVFGIKLRAPVEVAENTTTGELYWGQPREIKA